MTVKQFKKLVAGLPKHTDGWQVVMAKDAEGNGFNLFAKNGLSFDDTSDCTQYFDKHSDELCSYNEDDYSDFEEYKEHISNYPQLKPCIVLWP